MFILRKITKAVKNKFIDKILNIPKAVLLGCFCLKIMIQLHYSLSRKERLRGEIRVSKLFTQGKAFISFPLRIVYLEEEKKEDVSAQVLFSVPKKRFKRAVKRNRLRRQMKEAYRLHKKEFVEFLATKTHTLNIAITYISNDELPYAQIEKKMIEALQKIEKAIV